MAANCATLRPAGKDLVFKQIIERGLRRVLLHVALAYVLALIPLAVSWFQGTFLYDASLHPSALRDIGYFEQYFLLLPFLVWFSAYYLNALESALLSLRQRGAVKMDDESYVSFAHAANRVFAHPVITYSPYVVSVAINVFILFAFWLASENAWYCPKRSPMYAAIIATAIPALLLYYLLPALVLRIGALYFIVKRFLAAEVNIQPLHPDKCGGLSPLGNFSLRVTAAGVILGICVLLGIICNVRLLNLPIVHPTNILIMAGYVGCLIVVFFLPLMAAKNSMQAAKHHALLLISNEFNEAMSKAMGALGVDESKKTIDLTEMETLNKLYRVANTMPVYPFNAGNMFRFFSSVLWPLVLLVAQWLIGKL